MANKAQAKRQKKTIRAEPSQRAPHDPAVMPIGRRGAAPQRQRASVQRQLLQRLLKTKASE
jgi:hypothetical protein